MNQQQEKALRKLLKRNPNPPEEDKVKEFIRQQLESQGWQVKVKLGRTHGIDIEATKGASRWVIEAKGWGGGSEQQQGNYFQSAVCELLQRMELDDGKYSLAFPDLPRYRGLWGRFSPAAKQRIGVSCLFVDKEGKIAEA